MVAVPVILFLPTAGNVVIAGIAGKVGSVARTEMFPPAGAGPEYVYAAGWLTAPETTPPPTTIFPFTSIFPFRRDLVPARKMVPVEAEPFAAVILPVTVSVLES